MVPASPVGPKLRTSVEALILAWRNGEDPDLSGLLEFLWASLYERIPDLTGSLRKEDQHRILEDFLVQLGFPACPDLQYLAGPVLWYAREKGVVPPARGEGEAEAWTLNEAKYRAAAATLAEGRTAYGDWMRDALRAILSEQQ
jgi:hypothetical protein